MSIKDFARLDLNGEDCAQGRIFVDPGTAQIVDLSSARLLHCGVDTVRQLYRGLLRPEVMCLFDKPGAMVDFAGQRWHAGRVGKDSGYQYKLQNADLGFILLVKNFNAKLENIGPHLKIEVSPHAINTFSPERLQERLFATIHGYCRTPHVAMIAAICLATGARWGEAQGLTPDKVRNQLVTFVNTKGKRVRSIPIALELEQQIHRHFKLHGQFSNCLNSFDKALGESRLPVPAGQSSHVLRHTFASRFVMNGGNILTLQKILGHTTLAMTMRYTHLAPDHLQDAVKLGPVADYQHFLAIITSTG